MAIDCLVCSIRFLCSLRHSKNPAYQLCLLQMLNVYMQQEEDLVLNGGEVVCSMFLLHTLQPAQFGQPAPADETDDMNRIETTVFELAGPDRPGLLAEVTHLLTHNGCNVRSAAVSVGLRFVPGFVLAT